MKPATLDRKVRDVQTEARAQARMWLSRSELGPQSVSVAFVVLASAYVRTAELRGETVDLWELTT